MKINKIIETVEYYCKLHSKKANCKWLQKDKQACDYCAFKTKVTLK